MNGHHHKYVSADAAFDNYYGHNVEGAHDIKCSQK